MEHVFSGETTAIDRSKFSKIWYSDLEETERTEWEDLAESSSLKEFLGSLKMVPLYQYISNYVYWWFYKAKSENVTDEEVIDDLTKKVAEEFRKNRMPKEKCKEKYVYKILTEEWSREWDNFENKSTERIFELALGLNLPVNDVEALLQKAVKRAGFNYYDKEELLTFCVIRYQDQYRYECLEALIRDWDKIPAIVGKDFVELKGSTIEVRNDLEINMKENEKIYKDDQFLFQNLNEGLKFFFGKYKSQVVTERTAAKIFENLYQEVTAKYEKDILAFKNIYRATEELASTKLNITYEASSEIKIPKGTIFYAVKNTKKSGKHTVEFENREEVILPKMDFIEVTIPIKSCKSHVIGENKKSLPCYIKKEEKIKLKHVLADEESEFQAVAEGLTDITTKTTVAYSGKKGQTSFAAGELKAKAVPGLFIPENTVFLYNGQEYKSTEDVTAEAIAKVEVVCTTPHQPGEEITKTGTINYMKKMIHGICEISNPKPVKMKEATNTISKELFREFLYGHNVADLSIIETDGVEALLGRWFTETEITSVRFTKIQQQVNTKKQDDIEKNVVRRSDIITLVFMKYCKEILEDEYDGSREELTEMYQDFAVEVNKYLKKCRMMPLYLTNPYECFLAYLLKTDIPVDSLRNAWMIVNAGRRDMNV